MRLYPRLLVLGQMVAIAAIGLSGPPPLPPSPWFFVALTGALIGAWAVFAMRGARWTISPEVHPESRLVRSGPYRWIRHPMYTAVLVAGLAWVGESPTLWRWFALVALGAVLALKARREETLLAQKFPEYDGYRRATAAIIPGVW